MTEIRKGGTLLTRMPRVSGEISEVRIGSALVWNKAGLMRDDFNRASLGSSWDDVSPFGTTYPLAITDASTVRSGVPDGLTVLGKQTGISRYNVTTLTGDNGYIETRPMALGDLFYVSEVYARASNTSTFNSGVGLYLSAGHIYIASRLLGIEAIVADCGTFQAGDRLRMTFANRHFEVLRNGTKVGQWDDGLNLTSLGSGFRAVAMKCEGAKDLIDFGTFQAGPRRFSPPLDYVMMGNTA